MRDCYDKYTTININFKKSSKRMWASGNLDENITQY